VKKFPSQTYVSSCYFIYLNAHVSLRHMVHITGIIRDSRIWEMLASNT